MNLFLKTACGANILASTVVYIGVEPAFANSERAPEGAEFCIAADQADEARYVLGWFATQGDAQRALDAFIENNASNPFSFAEDNAFRYERAA